MEDNKSKNGYELVTHVVPASPLDDQGRDPITKRSSLTWRVTVGFGTLAAFLVLAANISLLAWVKTGHFFIENGVATVFEGSCDTSKQATLLGDLAINILSTILLAASNTCTQLLSAPTRDEIDAAHARGAWLDIGVPSVRNLRSIPKWRVLLWVSLFASSIPLHLMYNSVIFPTYSELDYQAVVVTEQFLNGSEWTPPNYVNNGVDDINVPQIQDMQQNIGALQRIENAECLQAYAVSMTISSWRNVLLVTDFSYPDNSVLGVFSHTAESYDFDLGWACNRTNFNYESTASYSDHCDVNSLIRDAADWTLMWHTPCIDNSTFSNCTLVGAPIKYCLAQPFPQHCTIRISISILAVVILCNMFKIVAMLATLLSKHTPLANVGDAISSFLDRPAPPEAALHGPLSARDVRNGKWKPLESPQTDAAETSARTPRESTEAGVPRRPRSVLSFRAATRGRWILTLTLCVVVWIAALALFFSGRSTSLSKQAFSTFWTADTNAATNNEVGITVGASLISNVLLANLPQLIISFIYLWYNNILTCMLLARETSDFVKHRKALRVSRPLAGTAQKGTYWLQLPYQYIIPLMVAMALLHWLVSRSIFLVQVQIYDSNGVHIPRRDLNICGYSIPSLELVLGLGGALILILVLLGFRRLPGGMPLVGPCSAAIAAACASNSGDLSASSAPLMYGVLREDDMVETDVKRVGLSSGPVDQMQDGIQYQ